MPALYDSLCADRLYSSPQLAGVEIPVSSHGMEVDTEDSGRPDAVCKGSFISVDVDDPAAPRIVAEVIETSDTTGNSVDNKRIVGKIVAQGESAARPSDIYAGEPRVTLEKWPGRDGQCIVVYHPAAKLLKDIRSGHVIIPFVNAESKAHGTVRGRPIKSGRDSSPKQR